MKYWLSIGSNEEPREWFLRKAVEIILELANVEKVSRVYESEPWGFDAYPFLNICVKIDTELPPKSLFKFLKRIEVMLGREEKGTFTSRFMFEPRPVDIDIVFWEGGIFEDEEITIPHPMTHRRKFVLIPLIDMGEDIVHPIIKKRLTEILAEIDDTSWIEVFGELSFSR